MLARMGKHFEVALRSLFLAVNTLLTFLLDLPHWLIVLLHRSDRSIISTSSNLSPERSALLWRSKSPVAA